MDTPYQWTKQVASHWGGTRNGTIVQLAERHRGARRDPQPVRPRHRRRADGARGGGHPRADDRQRRDAAALRGHGDELPFDDADAAERHTTQYFEMLGNRAIFHKGWTAVAKHKDPWLALRPRPRRRRVGALQRRGGLDAVERPRRAGARAARAAAAAVPDPGGPVQRAADGHPLGRADEPRHRRAARARHGAQPDVLPRHAAAERELGHQHQEQVVHGDRRRSPCPTAGRRRAHRPGRRLRRLVVLR